MLLNNSAPEKTLQKDNIFFKQLLYQSIICAIFTSAILNNNFHLVIINESIKQYNRHSKGAF